jgi:hypothetical protein
MRPGIVGVNDVRSPFARDGAKLARGADVPLSAQRESVGRQASVFGAPNQGRAGGRDHEDAISKIPEPGREQENLALAAAPTAARIDVNYPR